MKRKFVLILLLSVGYLKVSAQLKIDGNVSNKAAQPLVGASVILRNQGDTKIKTYSITNAEGYFSLQLNTPDSITIEISYIGYKNISKSIFIKTSQTIDFQMIEDVVELDEVKLRAPPIIDYGDTINYSVNAFKSQKDRVIADVLEKLPGIDVDADGRVSYMGEPIEKYYIEGLDLLEGKYNLANNNLPAQDVSDIQILENHQPIKIYDSIVYSDRASLNINLKKDVTLTGSATLGGGVLPALWEGGISPMLFNKKQQFVASLQSNNTGKNLVKELRSFRYPKLAIGIKGYLLAIQSVNEPPFRENFWLDNQTHLASLNYLRKINNKWQLKGNIHYLDAHKQHNGNTNTHIYSPTDTVSIMERTSNSHDSKVLKGAVTLEKNTHKGYYKQNVSMTST